MAKQDVVFTLGADGTAVMGEMSKVNKRMQKTLSDLGSMFLGLQGVAAGLRAAFAAAMEPITAYGKIEDTRVQLGIMLGNAEAAERLTASLQGMATNGVVGMQDLTAAARSLARVLPEDDIAEWVGRFADVAAASKLPAERLASMVARLNDMGRAEFTELANAGIPIYEALAEAVGASREEVIKMSAAGEIGARDFMRAIQLLTSEGAKFYKMNESLSGTTLGSIATLKAQYEELLVEIGKPMAEFLKPVLNELTAMLKEAKPYIKELAEAFSEAFGVFKADDMREQWKANMQAVVGLGKALAGLLGALMRVQNITNRLGIGALVLAVEALRPALDAVAELLTVIVEIVAEDEASVNALVDAFGLLRPALEAAMTPLRALVTLLGKVTTVARGLKESLSDAKVLLGRTFGFDMGETSMERLVRAEAEASKRAQARAEAEAEIVKHKEAEMRLLQEEEALRKRRFAVQQMLEEHVKAERLDTVQEIKDPDERKQGLMRVHGVYDSEDLDRRILAIMSSSAPTRMDEARLKELLALRLQVTRMERDAARARAEAERKIVEDKKKADQEAAQAELDALMEGLEARRKAAAEYAAKREAERESEWEEKATLAERRAYLFGLGSVQNAPGRVTVEQVRREMDELASVDPVKNADEIAAMERWLGKVKALERAELEEFRRMKEAPASERVDVVRASLAAVGGGGGALRVGDKQFEEAQRQTKLLTAIRDLLAGADIGKILAILS